MWFATCTAVYLVAAVVAAAKVMGLLNHDAVSYLTLARHWLEGRADLGVTGTWSPFLPWCLAAALSVFQDEALAVRAVMAVSGFVFLAGGGIFYARQPSAAVGWIAGVLTALIAAAMTGVLITPDLLGSGLFLLGFAALADALERPRLGTGLAAGVLLGLAYLAKAIFLPLAVASGLVLVGLAWWRSRRSRETAPNRPRAAPALALAAVAWLLAVSPWIATLSAKYDRPTFTRATIPQWSTIGPRDTLRDQPTNIRFYVPESGRQSQFEDESILPVTGWSPLESKAYFVHYLWHIRENLLEVQPNILRKIDVLNAGFLALLVFCAARVVRPRDSGLLSASGAWPLLAVPTLLLLAAYGVNFGDQIRYYLVAVPAIYLGALVAWPRVGAALAGRAGSVAGFAIATLALALPITLLRNDWLDWNSEGQDSERARAIAAALGPAGVRGGVASVGPPNRKHPAIFLSYHLGTTYHGTENARSVEDVEQSCARLLVLDRTSPLAPLLDADGRYVLAESRAPAAARVLRDAPFALWWRTAPPDPAACRHARPPEKPNGG